MTKVDIFSGFLGAGKTTLIKKLIAEAYQGEKLVLIENEFGEVGIDGGFLQDAGVEVTEMNSGCICCSLVGDFGQALEQVLAQFQPDRILIEPSGVGKLSDVIQAVQNLQGAQLQLNALVTVADAGKCRLYMKNFGEFYNNQIEHAAAIVLSRTDHIPEKKLLECVSMLREHNAAAPIITTPWAELTGGQILEAMENQDTLAHDLAHLVQHEGEKDCPVCGHDHGHEHTHEHGHSQDHNHECDHSHHHHGHEHGESCGCGHDHHHHDADEVFSSWGAETPQKYNEVELASMLDALSDEKEYGLVLRAKGIVPCIDGGWLHFDYVPGEENLRHGGPAITGRLCVIGAEIRADALRRLFQVD